MTDLRRFREWLTTPPKSSRVTILGYWLAGSVLRYVPANPTVQILNWVIAAAVVVLAAYVGYVVITNRRRRP